MSREDKQNQRPSTFELTDVRSQKEKMVMVKKFRRNKKGLKEQKKKGKKKKFLSVASKRRSVEHQR